MLLLRNNISNNTSRVAGLQAGMLGAGWDAGMLGAGWIAGMLAGMLVCWLGCWFAGWIAGMLGAGWDAGCAGWVRLPAHQHKCIYPTHA